MTEPRANLVCAILSALLVLGVLAPAVLSSLLAPGAEMKLPLALVLG